MLKYNLKDFFKETAIQNDEWVSNGHFLFKKSILTAGQRKMIEGFSPDDRINQLLSIIDTAKKIFDDQKEKLEFTPDIIFEHTTKTVEPETFNILYNNSLDLALKEEYYNFFISKKCKIFKGNGSLNPTLIFKDDEFVGILLPVRSDEEARGNAIDYNIYIAQLKQEQEAKEELKKLNKRCLYISNNKAVVRNKPLRSVSGLTGDDKYNNLFVDAVADEQNYLDVYVDLGIVYMSLNKSVREDKMIDDKEYYFGGYNHVTLDFYKEYINKSLEIDRWITIHEVKLMELAGETKEYIQKLEQHRKNIKALREKERLEEELKKQQEDKEYVDNQNQIANDIITQAEQSILKGEKVTNKDITTFTDRWSSNTTSLILHMMKQYNIKVPLKTQGWINNALCSIYKNENQDYYTYNYYNSSANSTVFSKYLDILVEKVKEKYNKVV